MSSFLIVVTTSYQQNNCANTALKFASAVLAKGHEINGVFFYEDGVDHLNQFISPISDETSIKQQWQEFAEQSDVPLMICTTAGNRRGVLGDDDAQDLGFTQGNLLVDAKEVGLTELVSLSAKCDRMVQF